MHAIVVRVTIRDAEGAREALTGQVVPAVSSGEGFQAGYWTWPADGSPTNGLSMAVFDTEENARAAAELVSSRVPAAVTLESVEVREVVASA